MSSESMERKKAHYLRDIIREEELMKYASKAGVTSFQKSVVKTYMKGINESQLAAKYDVMTNAIHEAIYGYVTTCRRYVGKQTNSRKLQWIERVEPEEDFLENILKGKNKGQNAAKEALVEASRVPPDKRICPGDFQCPFSSLPLSSAGNRRTKKRLFLKSGAAFRKVSTRKGATRAADDF